MSTAVNITTARQLLETPGLGRCELVNGELKVMSPSGFEHGRIVIRISRPLANFVEERALGEVVGAETGFLIRRDPDTVRAPDVAFLHASRVPPAPLRGFFEGAPDLAVEVLSPDDRPREIADKVEDWLQGGCSEVWVVNPQRRTLRIYRPDKQPVELDESSELSSEDLLPQFRLSVAEIFARR